MILYLNGSPKMKGSNSEYFLKKVGSEGNIRYLYKDSFSDIAGLMGDSKQIVISFPLYVDSPPNKVIEFMEYIMDNGIDIKDKEFYVICNSGFWESEQNDTATMIMENFCKDNGANYMGGFRIGAGEIIGKCDKKKVYRLVSIPFFIKINKFKEAILNERKMDAYTTIRPMTKRLYVWMANYNWKRKMKINGCNNKESLLDI